VAPATAGVIPPDEQSAMNGRTRKHDLHGPLELDAGDGRSQIDGRARTNLDTPRSSESRVAIARKARVSSVGSRRIRPFAIIGVPPPRALPTWRMVVHLYSPDKSRTRSSFRITPHSRSPEHAEPPLRRRAITVFGARGLLDASLADPDRMYFAELYQGTLKRTLPGPRTSKVASGASPAGRVCQPPHSKLRLADARTASRSKRTFADIVVKQKLERRGVPTF